MRTRPAIGHGLAIRISVAVTPRISADIAPADAVRMKWPARPITFVTHQPLADVSTSWQTAKWRISRSWGACRRTSIPAQLVIASDGSRECAALVASPWHETRPSRALAMTAPRSAKKRGVSAAFSIRMHASFRPAAAAQARRQDRDAGAACRRAARAEAARRGRLQHRLAVAASCPSSRSWISSPLSVSIRAGPWPALQGRRASR